MNPNSTLQLLEILARLVLLLPLAAGAILYLIGGKGQRYFATNPKSAKLQPGAPATRHRPETPSKVNPVSRTISF